MGATSQIATTGKILNTCFAPLFPFSSATIKIKKLEKNRMRDPAILATFPFEKKLEMKIEYENKAMP